LREQAKETKTHIDIDLRNGTNAWNEGRYFKAIHNWTWGVLGEVFQHAWRWVMYIVVGAIVLVLLMF
jgi:hypothetical protein